MDGPVGAQGDQHSLFDGQFQIGVGSELTAFRILPRERQHSRISPASQMCHVACGTIEGETGQNGRVPLKNYYPEETFLILRDQSDKVYWQGNVPEPAKSGWAKVEFSK